MKLKICIFPNDPIISYYKKGEIKERYFNPKNFFEEVHIISFIEKDIDEAKVQELVGNARLIIHSVGKIKIIGRNKKLPKILNIIKKIKPDVIRSYNPLLEGWFAAQCSKNLNIPLFVSLHTQYDHNRKLMKKKNLKKFLALKYTEKFIEPFVLKTAKKITIVYKIIEPYVTKHVGKNPEVLYNKIDCKRFENATKIKSLPDSLIISVGNLTSIKNHQLLIKTMKRINSHLLIIGNGELYEDYQQMIKKLNLKEKVSIIKSIENKKIHDYYKSAKLFALAYNTEIEGLPIPIMEAMATGLPVVIPHPKEGFSEGLEGIAIFSENDEKSFAKNIKMILDDENLQDEISKKSLQKSKEFDILKIEAREAEIYAELIK